MKFDHDGYPLSDETLEHALLLLDVEPALLWALLKVESNAFGYLPSRRPVVRFERHVFSELTGGQFDLEHPELSNPVPGGYIRGAAEHARVNAAAKLDEDAALKSASWGIGQLMGQHFKEMGFKSIQQMVEMMGWSEDDQLLAAVRFISDEALEYSLRDHDWHAFAEHASFGRAGRDDYDIKLARAFARYEQELPNLDVRGAQASLLYLGFDPGPVDGFAGPRTRAAVIAFQRKRKMPVTGSLGLRTIEYLISEAFPF